MAIFDPSWITEIIDLNEEIKYAFNISILVKSYYININILCYIILLIQL